MSLKQKINTYPKTGRERVVATQAAIVGLLGGTVIGVGFAMMAEREGAQEGLKRPAPVERVVDVDAETFDELGIDKGSIVYNGTTDTYVVYVDETEANPVQDPGWYEIDMNKLAIPEQQMQGE